MNRMKSNKRGQAAMEYVHTYGWILLSIIAIGGVTIYYFLDTNTGLIPFRCSFNAGLTCLDANTDNTTLQMVMLNENAFSIRNISILIKGTCNSEANTTDTNPHNNPNTLKQNQQAIFKFDCQNLTGLEITEKINFTFINVETGQEHSKIGTIEYKPGK